MSSNARLAALLCRQDGLVTLEQALSHGVSTSTVQRRARRGDWTRIAPRVFLVTGHQLTDRARIRAASLWAGDRAAVSGAAAAYWHGLLARPPTVVEITVPRVRGLRGRPGVRVRRRDLARDDVTDARGIRLTGVALTVLETAAQMRDGSTFLDRALQKHVDDGALYQAYCRNMGAKGGGRIADLLIATADRADSAAERLLITLLRRAGITGWTLGHPFRRWTVDLAFPALRLAIEVDGWAWHADVGRFRADREKGNALVGAGWVLLRFTWHDLRDRPDHVVREVRAALASAATRSA